MADPVRRGGSKKWFGWTKAHHERAVEAGYDSWPSWIEEIEGEKDFEICGASARRGPCSFRAGHGTGHLGRGRCSVHGGKSRGTPTNLVAAERMAAEDHELLSVRREMESASEILDTMFEEMREVGAVTISERTGQAHQELLAAVKSGKLPTIKKATSDLTDVLQMAADYISILDRLERWIDLKRKLTESESRILKTRHDMVTREQLARLVGRVARAMKGALERNVQDERIRHMVRVDMAQDLSDVLGVPEAEPE